MKMVKPRITQTTPYYQGLYFIDAKDLDEIPTESPPTGTPNTGGVGYN